MLKTHCRHVMFAVSAIALLSFACYVANSPSWDGIPNWGRLSVLSDAIFEWTYSRLFNRSLLGLGRLANVLILATFAYLALSQWWRPINRTAGWFFIPLGQASLYVYIMHAFVVIATEPIGYLHSGHFVITTLFHTVAIVIIYVAVRHRFLFRWIPR